MAIVSFQSDISHSSINRTTMATENASGGGASDRTPKAGVKKGILTRKGGGGGDGDDGHSVISGVTQNTLTTLTASEMGTIHRSPRAKSSAMFQKPTQLQTATVWDVISPPVRRKNCRIIVF